MFAQLPPEFSSLATQAAWAVQRGYLWKGIRSVMWDQPEAGRAYFQRAFELRAVVDDPLLQHTTYHLLGYENERGAEAALNVLEHLRPFLNRLSVRGGDKLEGSYLVNRAFENYRSGAYDQVPGKVWLAWRRDSAYLFNRGVVSIFVRSLLKAAQ
jgi:hypothetical protein